MSIYVIAVCDDKTECAFGGTDVPICGSECDAKNIKFFRLVRFVYIIFVQNGDTPRSIRISQTATAECGAWLMLIVNPTYMFLHFVTGARTENTASRNTCCVMGMSNVKMGQMRIQKFVMCVPRKEGGPGGEVQTR